jgi:hypothetical protein
VTAEWMDLAARRDHVRQCSGRQSGRARQARVRGPTSIKRRVWRRAGDGGGVGGVVGWMVSG